MRVLLVEDSNSDTELLTELFAKYDTIAIDRVPDGQKALDYVRREAEYGQAARPDIILLDLSLPRVNGYEVLRILKGDAELALFPVIVLTTTSSPSERERCKRLGAEMFLSKPMSLHGYEEMIRMLIAVDFPRLTQMRMAGKA